MTVESLGIIFLLLGERALSSRLGHNGSGSLVSYYLLGTPIYKSSNGTATFCCIAIFLCFYYIMVKHRRIYIVPLIFLSIGIIFSGSRKGLLFLLIIIIYSLFIMEKSSILKKIMLMLILPVLLYIILFKIPIIHELIGNRLLSLILNLQGNLNIDDGNSFNMRMILADKAKQYFYQKPLFGWGLSVFTKNNNGYGPENNYLELMVSSGIIGLLSYYSYAYIAICNIIKKYLKYDNLFRVFSVIIIVLLTIDIGTVSYCWLNTTLWIMCFFVALRRNKNIENDKKGEIWTER